MAAKRKIEGFSAGCPACEETLELVNRIACPSCEVTIHDMNDSAIARRAKELGVQSVPAVVIDRTPAHCCAGRGPASGPVFFRLCPPRQLRRVYRPSSGLLSGSLPFREDPDLHAGLSEEGNRISANTSLSSAISPT